MARSRSTSRKSTKKCSRGRVAVKAHVHGSRKVKSMCRKSPKKSRSRSKSRSPKKSRGKKVSFMTKQGRVSFTVRPAGSKKSKRKPTKYQLFVKKFRKQHPEIPGGPKLITAAAKAWNKTQ